MLDYLKSRGCKIGGVTQGERGVLWYDESGEVRTLAALPVPQARVRDTSGAGDVFHGAYVYSYLKHPRKSWEEHFQFAQHAAAYKIQHLGNEAGLPTLEAIKELPASSITLRRDRPPAGAGQQRRHVTQSLIGCQFFQAYRPTPPPVRMFGRRAWDVDLIGDAKNIFDRDRDQPGRRGRRECHNIFEADLLAAGGGRERGIEGGARTVTFFIGLAGIGIDCALDLEVVPAHAPGERRQEPSRFRSNSMTR